MPKNPYAKRRGGDLSPTLSPQSGDARASRRRRQKARQDAHEPQAAPVVEVIAPPTGGDVDPFHRYGKARLDNRVAAYARDHGLQVEGLRSLDASQQSARRARRELERLGRGDEADLVDRLVASHAGPLAAALTHAGADASYVESCWRYFVDGCRDRRPTSSEEVELMMMRARHRATAEASFIGAAKIGGPAAPSSTKAFTMPNGVKGQFKGPSGRELAAEARAADEAALRVELNLAALRPPEASTRSAMQARLEAILEHEAKASEEWKRKLLSERSNAIDVVAVPSVSVAEEQEPAPVAVAVPPAPVPPLPSTTSTSSPSTTSTAPSPPEKIVYEAVPAGGIAYPAWARPPAHVAPAAPDPFAEIRRMPEPVRGELGFARLVSPWKDRAQLARDQGRPYAGPRSIPSFVAKWLGDTGRAGVLEHMTRVLGFHVEQDTEIRSN